MKIFYKKIIQLDDKLLVQFGIDTRRAEIKSQPADKVLIMDFSNNTGAAAYMILGKNLKLYLKVARYDTEKKYLEAVVKPEVILLPTGDVAEVNHIWVDDNKNILAVKITNTTSLSDRRTGKTFWVKSGQKIGFDLDHGYIDTINDTRRFI